MACKKFPINENEELARVIFSPSMVNGDRPSHTAFKIGFNSQGKAEENVSLWRMKIKIPSRENVNFESRIQGDSLCGYAKIITHLINSLKVENCSSSVWRTSSNENHYHAGIFYEIDSVPVIGENDNKHLALLTSILATRSTMIFFSQENLND